MNTRLLSRLPLILLIAVILTIIPAGQTQSKALAFSPALVGNSNTYLPLTLKNFVAGPPCSAVGQFCAEYFNNRNLNGPPTIARTEATINHDWGTGSPGNGVPNDNFSARWTGRFTFNAGSYTFIARTDDGMRVWVDGTLIIDQWRDQNVTEYRANRTLTAGEHDIRVEYYDAVGGALAQFRWETGDCAVGQYRAEYFSNRDLTGASTFTRCENGPLNYDWGTGGPGNGVPNDGFSARWTGRFTFNAGTYAFIARTDDGMRVWVDGVLIIDQWRDQNVTEYRANRTLTAGEHEVRVEYYDAVAGAIAQLRWEAGACAVGQYRAEYYSNRTLIGTPTFARCEDAPLNHDWGTGGPGNGVPNDSFSARWTGRFTFSAGTYTFIARTDDGMRVWVDNTLIIDEWRDQAAMEYRVNRTLTAGEHDIRVEYYDAVAGAIAQLRWEAGACAVGQYRAEYFSNRNLTGAPTFVRCEDTPLNHDWGTGGPGNGVPNDGFSARWTGRFTFNAGTYTFIARTDDGMRVWVDNTLIIDQWRDQAATEYRADRTLTAGEHEVRVEYYDAVAGAIAQLRWESGLCPVGQYRAEYFNNRDLTGTPTFIRCEGSINNNWGTGGPGNGVSNDNFSVRWRGRFNFNADTYTFIARTDDGVRVWVDETQIINEWRVQAATEFRATRPMSAGEHEIRVEYFDADRDATALFRWETGAACPVGQYRAEYYTNSDLSGAPLFVRCENSINNNWGAGGPGNGIGNDNFSVRWTGRFDFATNTYAFIARTDDGIRAWIDGSIILNEWRIQSVRDYRVNRFVTAGQHEIRVEYFEAGMDAIATFRWEAAALQ